MTEMETMRNEEEVGQDQEAWEQERDEDEALRGCPWSWVSDPEQICDGTPKR